MAIIQKGAKKDGIEFHQKQIGIFMVPIWINDEIGIAYQLIVMVDLLAVTSNNSMVIKLIIPPSRLIFVDTNYRQEGQKWLHFLLSW